MFETFAYFCAVAFPVLVISLWVLTWLASLFSKENY